jgi:hypothetical protein
MWVPLKTCQRKGRSVCTIVTVVLAVACVAGAVSATQQTTSTAAEVDAVARARRALADQLQVPVETVSLRRVSVAEWRDSSLGCPEAGRVYTQQLIAGYKVALAHDGREHDVHVAAGRAIVCDARTGSGKVSTEVVLAPAKRAADRVKDAIAARTRVALSDVRVDRSRPFRAATPSCPGAPPQPRGPAFVVEARAGGATFVYYADDAVTVSCE